MIIPFGKFKGTFLCDLPGDYLAWLQTIELRDPLRAAIFTEAKERKFEHNNQISSVPHIAVVDELIGAGLRTLAMKYHPDRGGNPEKMVAINTAVDWMRSQVRMLT